MWMTDECHTASGQAFCASPLWIAGNGEALTTMSFSDKLGTGIVSTY
jgi:hypothetical protein